MCGQEAGIPCSLASPRSAIFPEWSYMWPWKRMVLRGRARASLGQVPRLLQPEPHSSANLGRCLGNSLLQHKESTLVLGWMTCSAWDNSAYVLRAASGASLSLDEFRACQEEVCAVTLTSFAVFLAPHDIFVFTSICVVSCGAVQKVMLYLGWLRACPVCTESCVQSPV